MSAATELQVLCSAPCLTREPGFPCPRLRCLILAARDGHAVARELLFTLLRPLAVRQARRFCPRPADAEDLAQSALLLAFRSLSQLRDCRRVAAWLRRIVQNSFRMNHRKPSPSLRDCVDPALVPSSSAGPDELLDALELRRRASTLFATLPTILRAVFHLRVLAGLSTAETAHLLSITPEAVRTRLSRARRAIACA